MHRVIYSLKADELNCHRGFIHPLATDKFVLSVLLLNCLNREVRLVLFVLCVCVWMLMHLPRWELGSAKSRKFICKRRTLTLSDQDKNFCFTFALLSNWCNGRVLISSEWKQKVIKCCSSKALLRYGTVLGFILLKKSLVFCVFQWTLGGLFSEKLKILQRSLMMALSRCSTALRWRLALRCCAVPVGSSTMSSRPPTTARPQFLTQSALFHQSKAKASPDPNKITSGKSMQSQFAVHCYHP